MATAADRPAAQAPAGSARRPGVTTRRARIDLGRIIMVPAAAFVLLLDLRTLARTVSAGGWAHLPVTLLICAFYAVVIWCYLRRRPAVATSASVTAHVAAVTATLAPMLFPLLPATIPGTAAQVAGGVLLMIGTAWSVWALRSLGRSLSVLAQARVVVERGPYRWIRHPLYTGELVSSLGLAISIGSPAAAVLWLALCGLQVYRAVREEQVLLLALPAYAGYRSRTAALLPGVF